MNQKPITFSGIFLTEFKEGVEVKSIEIPIIQRDYAQGRELKEVERIRTQFLSVLHDALTGKCEPIKLDFVYGNITDGKLIPLDGQQRLTTLFLLHWYIAKKDKVEREKYEFLTNFTYRTRFSSTHFCERLMEATPDFSVENISDWIIDQSWYMYSWDYDPTICSMLVMLNDIHLLFKDDTDLWNKINNEEISLISFYFLPLEDMGLTDSLYIKMNSRGKPLTSFEHFKAEFEAMIKNFSNDLYGEFIEKVDNDWVDMLWKYRGDDESVDDEFMRYFRFVTEVICYKDGIKIAEDNFDIARNIFSNLNQDAKENFRFLFKSFDCWNELISIKDFFYNTFSKHSHEVGKVTIFDDNTNLFEECCSKYGKWTSRRRDFTLNNTLLLYATLVYQANKDIVDQEKFEDRIRIVRNLVMNSQDEIREDRMTALLNDINQIILEAKITQNNLGFNENQKIQEIEKLQWRTDNSNLVGSINELEDHSLLQGNISIIGIDEPAKFKNRASNFIRLFNKDINYDSLRKALLSIDDYSQLASWRFLLGNNNASSWRELFTPSKQRKRFNKTKETLLELLDSICGDFGEYLNTITENYLLDQNQIKDWRYYFIKYQAMRVGNSGVYYWYNDSSKTKENQYEVFMMNTSLSLNGRHWNPFLYILYNDENFKDMFSLEEYGAPLIISQKAQKLICKNTCWEIYNSNDEIVKTIEIKQENGIDTVDRIELIKNKLND